ncbi:hypothetical protein IMSHALPRED_003560 [Imshaugia aleurites]|uniref:Uncharacterized protein n=1 Tax=Imshaugia aleurites TaxID=172621 RepID=A0A8H3IKW2_9LECA|nr:hypothetical protein IMSHALPRED_003560 [Imshaugia aleurites]
MNRQLILGTRALSITQETIAPIQLSRSLSSRTNTHDRNGSNNVSHVGEWLEFLNNNAETIPSSIVKSKHGQSSPRSLKTLTCRAPIDALEQFVPQEVLERVKDSPSHYTRGSDAVVTTSNRTTSANANRQDCIKKIRDILREIAKDIMAEASRKPPKQLPKKPPTKLPEAEARRRFEEQKRQQRVAKVHEKIVRGREERIQARGPRN